MGVVRLEDPSKGQVKRWKYIDTKAHHLELWRHWGQEIDPNSFQGKRDRQTERHREKYDI